MNIVSVTRLRLRSIRFLPAFLYRALRAAIQVRRADGCLAFTAGRRGEAFWTITVWRNEAALQAFVLSGAHRIAMRYLVKWCDESSTARFEWGSALAPDWTEAVRRMASVGRVTPIPHASPAHKAGNALGEEATKTTLNKPIAWDS
jgi:heme-degrading monooxygenase HmoA